MPAPSAALSDAFDRLSMRERALATVALLAVLYFMLDLLWLQPMKDGQGALRTQLEAQVSQTQQLQAEMARLVAQRARLDAQETVGGAELQEDVFTSFIAQGIPDAARIGQLIRELLQASQALALESLKTLPVRPVLRPAEGPTKAGPGDTAVVAASRQVYLHGVEAAVRGHFLDLLPYLARLQAYPEPLLWGDLQLQAEEHPNSLLRLTVLTLGEQRDAPIQP